MVNVAVLGGTGHVGKTIVEVLKEDPNHSVIILSRKAVTSDTGAPVVAVDYDDVAALKTVLEQHKIHTVISCLGTHDQALADVQNAVIRAAETSSTTKRFIPSNWACPRDPESVAASARGSYFQRQGPDLLRQTSLEWTEVLNGYFLDYWGMPYIKSHMTSSTPAIDIANKVAAIPGTGNEVISFAYTFDVAKVVSRLLELSTWEEETYIISDNLTWNEFLHLAEEARGSKFEVHYDSEEKLRRGQITELPAHKEQYPYFPKEQLVFLYAGLETLMAMGKFELPIEKGLNKRFPDIKMLTVAEMLNNTWKGK
ncbi:hypothetical protein EDB81DRAFT_859843 [Dactylonectria macrodidyma]|uniref:NAD(P)-binding domain-containing protein n=1 Tax=Dactylonectria macrodidyma TaxID=307937 RepID=A0A9P9E652_9HYPO|nr:hypothetical protein EDB81DRAFT_859843 [Dactylonectria macrodidyma]